MSYLFKKGATSQSIEIYIIDSTDGTPETGVLWNTGIDLKYRRKDAAVVSITEAALTTPALTDTWETGGFLEIGNGVYRLDLPDAALASAAGIDRVVVFGTVTGMVVLPVTIHLTDIDLNTALASSTIGTCTTNTDMRGTDSAALASVCTEARLAALTDWINGGRLDLLLDAIKAIIDELIIHETTIASTTDDKTFVLTASGLDGDTSADDDAWNDASVVITDVTGTAKELRKVADYGGVAKQIILDRVCKFNLAAGDKVKFYPAYTSTASAGSVTQQNIDDITDAVWDELNSGHMAQGTTGQRLHHAGRGRL